MKQFYFIKIENLWLGFGGTLEADFSNAKIFQGNNPNTIKYLKNYPQENIDIFWCDINEVQLIRDEKLKELLG